MNTSAPTNQTHDATTGNARALGIGFLRRSMAGALLAVAITTTAVSLAATSHADDGAPPPNVEATISVPAPLAPWLSTINRFDSCWRQWSFSNGGLHCG